MTTPPFRNPDEPLTDSATIGEFWRWAMSDLLGNRNRGILAEFLVTKALNGSLDTPRIEWDCADIEYRGRKIEVKSSSYVQSWHSSASKPSALNFGVRAARECWDGRTNTYTYGTRRYADLYVFCVFPKDPTNPTRDVTAVDQWDFYIATTARIEQMISPETKSIGLATVRRICGDPVPLSGIKPAVDAWIDTL